MSFQPHIDTTPAQDQNMFSINDNTHCNFNPLKNDLDTPTDLKDLLIELKDRGISKLHGVCNFDYEDDISFILCETIYGTLLMIGIMDNITFFNTNEVIDTDVISIKESDCGIIPNYILKTLKDLDYCYITSDGFQFDEDNKFVFDDNTFIYEKLSLSNFSYIIIPFVNYDDFVELNDNNTIAHYISFNNTNFSREIIRNDMLHLLDTDEFYTLIIPGSDDKYRPEQLLCHLFKGDISNVDNKSKSIMGNNVSIDGNMLITDNTSYKIIKTITKSNGKILKIDGVLECESTINTMPTKTEKLQKVTVLNILTTDIKLKLFRSELDSKNHVKTLDTSKLLSEELSDLIKYISIFQTIEGDKLLNNVKQVIEEYSTKDYPFDYEDNNVSDINIQYDEMMNISAEINSLKLNIETTLKRLQKSNNKLRRILNL